MATRQPLDEPLRLDTNPVLSLAFSPDGRILASGSGQLMDSESNVETVRLWDAKKRQPIGESLRGHTSFVLSLAFSPDGKMLASASRDGSVWLWDVSPDSWVLQACRRANRNLSLTEWQHYIGKEVPYKKTCPELPPRKGEPAK